MANDAILKFGTQVTMASDSATLAVAAMSPSSAVIASNITSANFGPNFPLADVVLSFSGTNSISSASNFVVLYRRDLDINGTADSPQPSTASPPFSGRQVGMFVAPAFSASSQYSNSTFLICESVGLNHLSEFYIENKLNLPIGAGWTLRVTPKTYTPSA